MGLTKQYLRFIPAGSFNIIASHNCNVKFITLQGHEGRFVAVGACEHIIIWDLHLGEKAQVLPGEKAAVSAICPSPNNKHIAGGYSDGIINVYDLKSTEIINIFSGHRSEITVLEFDKQGHKLASGSKDTDVIIWDIVAETGLCRLSGHKAPITQVKFMNDYPIIITAAKDSLIKFWDLDTQNCFRTIVGHRTEIWGLILLKNNKYLVSGCGDAEIRVWKLIMKNDENKNNDLSEKLDLTNLEDDDPSYPLQCFKVGSLLRIGKGRVISMCSDSNGQILACHGTDQQIELFYFCTNEEAKIRLKKRLKKERKKQETINEQQINENLELTLSDEVKRLTPLKLNNKPKSIDLILMKSDEIRIVINLFNNQIELNSLSLKQTNETKNLKRIYNQGHRSDIKVVSFSSDSQAIISGSGESVKIWNRSSQAYLRTISTDYVLSLTFIQGDRMALAGLKNGQLLIINIATGDIIETIPAHTHELWSICLTPDDRGCITGGSDKTVKFWNYEWIINDNNNTKLKELSLIHYKTLQLDENVLCCKITQNNKFLLVALLDSTVKIFFIDTFKFYLSLYGHKLPVLCMDISTDNTLIATGSADRNIKIWGMDFGDCHKSIFAHDDSITGLQFVPRTHYFFTCGKDGKVKQWDGDNFIKVITLQGHIGEAWSLSVSPNGKYVISCGSDRVLRLYEKSDQPLVIEDEEEEEREKQQELLTGDETHVPGHKDLNLPSKKTIGSEQSAENILECLDICRKYQIELDEHNQQITKIKIPILMEALNVNNIDDFLLETFKKIRCSDLEETLLLLPFNSVCELLPLLLNLIKRNIYIELITKIILFLIKLHYRPIIANENLLKYLIIIQNELRNKVEEFNDLIGYNYYGMQFIQRNIEQADGIQLFRDATFKKKKDNKKKKQREKLKRSILVLNN